MSQSQKKIRQDTNHKATSPTQFQYDSKACAIIPKLPTTKITCYKFIRIWPPNFDKCILMSRKWALSEIASPLVPYYHDYN
jgi:hypothetical protein